MHNPYIEVDLTPGEKKLVMEFAPWFIMDPVTQMDLKNPRKKWIRFKAGAIYEVIGELSYHCNRCRSVYKQDMLDALASHFESYEKRK
ncbi:MAG: hypothetical protein EPN21_05930 [Methylococcaceae bacterium]|nr:MAG: hypothetical protein EPN21_05930 [Methylococcaceae bacterium]